MKSPYWLGACCWLLGGDIALPAAAQTPAASARHAEMRAGHEERRLERDSAQVERRDQREAARDAAAGDRRDPREFLREMREAREARGEGRPERLDDIQGTLEERRAKLQEKLTKRHETRAARAEAQRALLVDRFGPVRDNPALRNELRHHAWRLARLHRIQLLAVTEGRDPLKVRVEQLITKENARHEQAMQKFAKPALSATASQGGAR